MKQEDGSLKLEVLVSRLVTFLLFISSLYRPKFVLVRRVECCELRVNNGQQTRYRKVPFYDEHYALHRFLVMRLVSILFQE
jgi:hypothetical protein